MSFRFDMRNKDSQQQAIVRKRDSADKARKQSSVPEKVKPYWENDGIEGFKMPKAGDYESVSFHKAGKEILELRVSGTAIVNQPCGFEGVDIHQWLWARGLDFVKELESPQKLIITSHDVAERVLTVHWSSLRKV